MFDEFVRRVSQSSTHFFLLYFVLCINYNIFISSSSSPVNIIRIISTKIISFVYSCCYFIFKHIFSLTKDTNTNCNDNQKTNRGQAHRQRIKIRKRNSQNQNIQTNSRWRKRKRIGKTHFVFISVLYSNRKKEETNQKYIFFHSTTAEKIDKCVSAQHRAFLLSSLSPLTSLALPLSSLRIETNAMTTDFLPFSRLIFGSIIFLRSWTKCLFG